MSYCHNCPIAPLLHPPFRELCQDPLPDEPKPQSRVWELFPDCPGDPGQLLPFIFTSAASGAASPGCSLHSPSSCCSHPSHAPATPSLWIEGKGGAGAALESGLCTAPAALGGSLPSAHRAGGKRGSLQHPRSCGRQCLDTALSQWGPAASRELPVPGRGVAVPSWLDGAGSQDRRCRVLLAAAE